jgi:hypothetical protein
MRAVRFHIHREHHWNTAYAFYNDMILTTTESSLGLMCACLTVVKPLLRKTRDLAISSTSGLSSLLSISARTHNKSSGSSSGHSYYRSESQDGISRTRQYDVDTIALAPHSNMQKNVALDGLHPWQEHDDALSLGR